MNTQILKSIYSIESNCLYKQSDLKLFADTFLNSNQKSEYKLYHQYLFRSEIWEEHIKEHYKYKLNDQPFNWNLKSLQEIIEEHSHFFVGYIKLKYKRKYSELFLSIHHMLPCNYDPSNYYKVTGYCVKTQDKAYDYMYENTINFGYKHFDHPIIIDSEIYKAVNMWQKRIKRSLLK